MEKEAAFPLKSTSSSVHAHWVLTPVLTSALCCASDLHHHLPYTSRNRERRMQTCGSPQSGLAKPCPDKGNSHPHSIAPSYFQGHNTSSDPSRKFPLCLLLITEVISPSHVIKLISETAMMPTPLDKYELRSHSRQDKSKNQRMFYTGAH